MNPFETLPDEVIFDMCHQMSTTELDNFTKASRRNYEVCRDILYKRKTAFAIEAGDVIYRYLLRKYIHTSTSYLAIINVDLTDDLIIDNSRIGSEIKKLVNDLTNQLNQYVQEHGQFDEEGNLVISRSYINIEFKIASELLPAVRVTYINPSNMEGKDFILEMTIREFLDYIKELVLRNVALHDYSPIQGITASPYIR